MTKAKPSKPIALVTGARQGLGRSIALNLANSGFDIVIMDLQHDEVADEAISQIKKTGARVSFIAGDLADIDKHDTILNEAWSAFGPISCLVNNAGIAARPLCDVLDLGAQAFDQNLNINLRGTFFLSQNVARRMLADPASDIYRSILFITSIAAEFVSNDRAQYCISKSALSMVAKQFAVRLAKDNIHVHEIRPGFIETEMTGSADTSPIDAYIADGAVPLRRWGAPSDVGKLCSTLATGTLPYLTGQPIYVDGGFHLPTV